jgi:hypothetical protein
MVIADLPSAPRPYLLLGRIYRDRLQDPRAAHEMFKHYLALAPNGRDAAHLRLELAAEKLTSAEKRR